MEEVMVAVKSSELCALYFTMGVLFAAVVALAGGWLVSAVRRSDEKFWAKLDADSAKFRARTEELEREAELTRLRAEVAELRRAALEVKEVA